VKFEPTEIAGAYLISPDRHHDERGWFMRTYCRRTFAALGIEGEMVQASLAQNVRRGTIRGLHWQRAPHAEGKLIACPRGALFDVLVDLRPSSSTYLVWIARRLDGENGQALYAPPGVAHGYQTLEDDSWVHYQMSAEFAPAAVAGVRFDDPTFAIDWPLPVSLVSARDRALPHYATIAPMPLVVGL
jgi:dTDP-4-dehydrorhamnose 3,5-epimerase